MLITDFFNSIFSLMPSLLLEEVLYFILSLQLFNFVIIILAVLLITTYLPRKIESLNFLHRISFGYFIFNFILTTVDILARINSNNHLNQNGKDSTIDLLFTYIQGDYLFFHLVFIFVSLMLIIFFYGTIDKFVLQNGDELEFPLIIIFIAVSVLVLFYVHTLIEFLLALETISLASYICVGYERQNRHSSYASVQYFILGAIPSGFLILGIGLLYNKLGVLNFEDLDLSLSNNKIMNSKDYFNLSINEFLYTQEIYSNPLQNLLLENDLSWTSYFNSNTVDIASILSNTRMPVVLIAILFILFNFFFKLTAAPFHFWAPSIYKYAPTVTVSYIAIISKAMVIFLLFKFILTIYAPFILILTPVFLGVALLTIFIGILGALTERFIKPFFVYSSMGHVGFMLAGLSLFSLNGFIATFHYLFVYIISSFLMWFILMYVGQETRYLNSFKILKNKNPILVLIFVFLIFSMSGIPPLGGFFIKLDVLVALLDSSRYFVTAALFFFTVVTFFYYLKIIKILFFENFDNKFIKIYEINPPRLQLFVFLFIFLLCYMCLITNSAYHIGQNFLIENL